jgi:hypothetical protein
VRDGGKVGWPMVGRVGNGRRGIVFKQKNDKNDNKGVGRES